MAVRSLRLNPSLRHQALYLKSGLEPVCCPHGSRVHCDAYCLQNNEITERYQLTNAWPYPTASSGVTVASAISNSLDTTMRLRGGAPTRLKLAGVNRRGKRGGGWVTQRQNALHNFAPIKLSLAGRGQAVTSGELYSYQCVHRAHGVHVCILNRRIAECPVAVIGGSICKIICRAAIWQPVV